MWSFHLSLLSIITPKHFVDFTHCIDVFCISAWNGLAQAIAEANTLDLFKSKLAH